MDPDKVRKDGRRATKAWRPWPVLLGKNIRQPLSPKFFRRVLHEANDSKPWLNQASKGRYKRKPCNFTFALTAAQFKRALKPDDVLGYPESASGSAESPWWGRTIRRAVSQFGQPCHRRCRRRLFSWPVQRATTDLNLRIDLLNLEIDLTSSPNQFADT